MGKGIIKLLNEIKEEILDIIYPPINKCIVCDAEFIGICPTCNTSIKRCIREGNIISYGHYKGALKKLLLEFKYKKNFTAGRVLADYIYKLIKENNIDAEVILFIPSSKKALKERGFNQCEFLAKEISKKLEIKIYRDIIKVKNIKEQKTLSKEDRVKNVRDAFKIRDKSNVKGKKIILLDDVVTTGATIYECEKILKEAGATSINILTVAKSFI